MHQPINKSDVTLGWDVGGAHLKAALVDADGVVLDVHQVVCPLWRGLDELRQALSELFSRFEITPQRHAITMTGELVDIFPNRLAGVLQIAQFMTEHLDGEILFYSAKKGFVSPSEVASVTESIASANWHASAGLIAKSIRHGLLVDIGSTTTDLILLKDGVVATQGFTDAERMRYDELIYAGVVRTPLMALCQQIKFNGHRVNLAAEHFATTADIFRLTGELALEDDMADTADGAAKTQFESARRLARMVGHDVEDASIDEWKTLAYAFREVQLMRLQDAISHLLGADSHAHLIGAGAGRFLVRALAERMNKPYDDVEGLLNASKASVHWAGVCLPAVAVASLMIGNEC